MLATSAAFSSIGVDDLAAATAFYGGTLGLRVTDVPDMGPLAELHLPVAHGERSVLLYESPGLRPGTATVLSFPVDDIDAVVAWLAERGVAMLRYDGFDQDENGIARGAGGGPDIAWFTDPSGNVLAVLSA